MAFIFDLSCYTVCFCIISTITRNTWVAVSSPALSVSLSPRLGLLLHMLDTACSCMMHSDGLTVHVQTWSFASLSSLSGRCLCLLYRTLCICVFFICVDCCWICLFTYGGWGWADHTLQGSVNLSPDVVSPHADTLDFHLYKLTASWP